jgi:hypothetical protein
MKRGYFQYRDAATRETWYRGKWYDETDEDSMAALKQRMEDDVESAASDIYWDRR